MNPQSDEITDDEIQYFDFYYQKFSKTIFFGKRVYKEQIVNDINEILRIKLGQDKQKIKQFVYLRGVRLTEYELIYCLKEVIQDGDQRLKQELISSLKTTQIYCPSNIIQVLDLIEQLDISLNQQNEILDNIQRLTLIVQRLQIQEQNQYYLLFDIYNRLSKFDYFKQSKQQQLMQIIRKCLIKNYEFMKDIDQIIELFNTLQQQKVLTKDQTILFDSIFNQYQNHITFESFIDIFYSYAKMDFQKSSNCVQFKEIIMDQDEFEQNQITKLIWSLCQIDFFNDQEILWNKLLSFIQIEKFNAYNINSLIVSLNKVSINHTLFIQMLKYNDKIQIQQKFILCKQLINQDIFDLNLTLSIINIEKQTHFNNIIQLKDFDQLLDYLQIMILSMQKFELYDFYETIYSRIGKVLDLKEYRKMNIDQLLRLLTYNSILENHLQTNTNYLVIQQKLLRISDHFDHLQNIRFLIAAQKESKLHKRLLNAIENQIETVGGRELVIQIEMLWKFNMIPQYEQLFALIQFRTVEILEELPILDQLKVVLMLKQDILNPTVLQMVLLNLFEIQNYLSSQNKQLILDELSHIESIQELQQSQELQQDYYDIMEQEFNNQSFIETTFQQIKIKQ